MVGMRQLTASRGVVEQGYVEGMHATGAVLRVGMHAATGAGAAGRHACNDGKGTA